MPLLSNNVFVNPREIYFLSKFILRIYFFVKRLCKIIYDIIEFIQVTRIVEAYPYTTVSEFLISEFLE